MRNLAIGFLLVLSCASASAQTEGESAFTATGDTCGDLTWQPSVLERFPNIGTVCRAVIERDGKVYAQFNGVVHRRYGSTVYIRFEGGEAVPGGDRAVKIDPPSDMTFRVGDRSIQVRDAQPGQDLTIYIPGDRFVVNLGDEFVPTAVADIAEVVPVAEVPESVEETPPPAPAESTQMAEAPTPPPVEPMPAVEPPPPAAVTTTPPTPAEGTPWLLYIGAAIAIIVIVLLVKRSRQSK